MPGPTNTSPIHSIIYTEISGGLNDIEDVEKAIAEFSPKSMETPGER